MSLNHSKYLKLLPSEIRVPARFQSVSLQSQIDTMRKDIAALCETRSKESLPKKHMLVG